MSWLVRLICKWRGRRWVEVSWFAGGSSYRCERCKAHGDSFWKCPSNWHREERIRVRA